MHADTEGLELKFTVYANVQGSVKETWKRNTECAHVSAHLNVFRPANYICVCALRAGVLEFKDFIFTRVFFFFYSTGARTLSKIATT